MLASGNLGLVFFTGFKKRLTQEKIEKLHPGLINKLVKHPGTSFLMVESEKDGPVVIGEGGKYILKTDKVVGQNPLSDFGENIAMHIKRTNSFSNVPDILLNSLYNPGTGEIAAFEELVGAHGGVGGPQNNPFLMYPKDLESKRITGIIGAEGVHKVIKPWADKAA